MLLLEDDGSRRRVAQCDNRRCSRSWATVLERRKDEERLVSQRSRVAVGEGLCAMGGSAAEPEGKVTTLVASSDRPMGAQSPGRGKDAMEAPLLVGTF